ncbi:MAG: CDP-archaeol synthase [Candidatus Saccharibacteria bacterium]|nr:CDP-archaeol synthase [Candidatus Saccharibacteria bacterium]
MDGNVFIQMLFLLGPAGIANSVAVVGNKIPCLKNWTTPMDFGLKFKNQRILGNHKTWRGLMLGIIGGCLTGILILYLINQFDYFRQELGFIEQVINPILLGGLLGFFALLGDALKSFFKRQLKIPPGKSWPVFDQIDYILGSYLLILILFDLSLTYYLVGLIMYALIHPLISNLGYILRLKKDRF